MEAALPAVYQALFAPARLAHAALGAEAFTELFGVGNPATSSIAQQGRALALVSSALVTAALVVGRAVGGLAERVSRRSTC